MSTPLFRIDDRARPSPSLARFALGPVSLVVAFGLYYGGFVGQLPAMCIVGAGLVAFQWASVLANGSRDAYDRAAIGLLSRGKASELGARLEAALPFRIFGPAAEHAARLGAVQSALGQKEEAARSWAKAVAGYRGGAVPRAVALGFAGAALDAGWSRDASRAYRALFDGDPDLPRVRVRLARSLAALGEDLDEVDALLAAEERHGGDAGEIAAARAARQDAGAPTKKKRKKGR